MTATNAARPEPGAVVVFGASGLLGATLCPLLEAWGHRVLRQSRGTGADVDIVCEPSDPAAVRRTLASLRPAAVVNLIALSNVDQCESDLAAAHEANVRTVDTLASAVKHAAPGAHLVHISTDHLYMGAGPHREDAAHPINVYALTKLDGELVALCAGATVLRTNFFGKSRAPRRQSFTDWIHQALVSGREFTVFDDVYFNALHMPTLARCVARSLELRITGVFNAGARDGLSKAGFALAFARELGLDTKRMRVGSVTDVKLAAPRPTDMRMAVSRFEEAFGMTMPTMDAEIAAAADDYRGEST